MLRGQNEFRARAGHGCKRALRQAGEKEIVHRTDFAGVTINQHTPRARQLEKHTTAIVPVGTLSQKAGLRELSRLGRNESAGDVKLPRECADSNACPSLQARDGHENAIMRPRKSHALAKMLAHLLHANRNREEVRDQLTKAAV